MAAPIVPLYYDNTHVRMSPVETALAARTPTPISDSVGVPRDARSGRGSGDGANAVAPPPQAVPPPKTTADVGKTEIDWLKTLGLAGAVGVGGAGLLAALRKRAVTINSVGGIGGNQLAVPNTQGTTSGGSYYGPFDPEGNYTDIELAPQTQALSDGRTRPLALTYQRAGVPGDANNPHVTPPPRPRDRATREGAYATQQALIERQRQIDAAYAARAKAESTRAAIEGATNRGSARGAVASALERAALTRAIEGAIK